MQVFFLIRREIRKWKRQIDRQKFARNGKIRLYLDARGRSGLLADLRSAPVQSCITTVSKGSFVGAMESLVSPFAIPGSGVSLGTRSVVKLRPVGVATHYALSPCVGVPYMRDEGLDQRQDSCSPLSQDIACPISHFRQIPVFHIMKTRQARQGSGCC